MDLSNQIWQVAGALVGIVALVFVLGAIARRLQSRGAIGGRELKIIDSTMLGARDRLVLVEVERSRVLFAMNANNITKLSEFPLSETAFEVELGEAIGARSGART